MPIPTRSLVTSLLIVALAVAAAQVAYRANAPSPKTLDFDIVCERFIAPASFNMDLNQGPTELESITASGFNGSVSEASRILFARDRDKPVTLTNHELSLEDSNNPNYPAPFLSLMRRGSIGKLRVEVAPGVEFASTGAPGTSPSLTIESRSENDVRLMISSAEIVLDEGNRYVIKEIEPGQPLDAFHATLSGKELAALRLRSGARSGTRARLTFKPATGDLPLLVSKQPLPVGASLEFTHAVNPSLRLDKKSVEGVADRKADLLVKSESAIIDTLAIVGDAEKREAPALHVTGSGRVNSLRQAGGELMPTWLDEILDKPLASRTWWLIGLGGAAAVLLKAVDHALGVIFERLIPKG